MQSEVTKFTEQLRKQVLNNARGKTGVEVVEALFNITDEMWEGGIDRAWSAAQVTDNVEMFDITWLTMLASRLKSA